MPDTRKRILYVEDDANARLLLRTVLELENYIVVTAETAKEGLHLACTEKFALLILDDRLPDGSGIKLAHYIRAFDTVTPIIFYTANSLPASIKEGFEAGAYAYLVKPCTPDVLVEKVLECIGVA